MHKKKSMNKIKYLKLPIHRNIETRRKKRNEENLQKFAVRKYFVYVY